MEKIKAAEFFELRPKDRDYNKHGTTRAENVQMEILGGGLCYSLRCGGQFYGVIIEYESD